MLENGNVKALSNFDCNMKPVLDEPWLVGFKRMMLYLLIQTESN